jgi:hypothetical protein
MTEGNIAKWAIKEGDSFSAGDVILEIETDKASMDVEAQDDGVLAKITMGDGSKGIKVGTRIGVLAEQGDDLSSLEIPPEENSAPPPKKEAAPKPTSETQAQAPSMSRPSGPSSADAPAKKTSKPAKKQTYPLLPSVEHLLRLYGLDPSAVEKMTPSGPNNRLLKGDVLAYLGSISASYPTDLSSKIAKFSRLDLSNIKIAPQAPAPKADKQPPTLTPEPVVEDLEVALPISMKAVLEVQARIQNTLGIFLPLSTFIERATDVANDNLPRSKAYKPTVDELFNEILGLDKVSAQGARGNFNPQITALSSPNPAAKGAATRKSDIIDILSGNSKSVPSSSSKRPMPGLSGSVNVFSLKVPKGEEKRAQIFLERVKTVLEAEPGRLVL